MSTLEDLTTAPAGPGGLAGFVGSLSRRLRPVSRRDVLVGAAVAGSALATRPRDYLLRPVDAYATICGPGNTAGSGWTVFCCTVNKGVNACPPGSFAAGWWKAADSSWCGRGYRYIVDCNASCSKCTSGCSDNMCDSKCWSCSCGTGSKATCDQRRICCNAFRYGQCNTQVRCSGGVHCRVVSCVAPYHWDNCTTTSLVDNRTSEHSAPCLPLWSQIEEKYIALGAQRSYLKGSVGPLRRMGDNRGSYVRYQGGCIYYTTATRAVAVSEFVYGVYATVGGPTGLLGYPKADKATGRPDSGWIQLFEKGAITDSASTATQVVNGASYSAWAAAGRESGPLGYPTSSRRSAAAGGWIQYFEHGAICDSTTTSTTAVIEVMYSAWARYGREAGILGYPTSPEVREEHGLSQAFQGGEAWAIGNGTAHVVRGSVLDAWKAAGGATGSYGYPVSETTSAGGDLLTCTFEGGTITA